MFHDICSSKVSFYCPCRYLHVEKKLHLKNRNRKFIVRLWKLPKLGLTFMSATLPWKLQASTNTKRCSSNFTCFKNLFFNSDSDQLEELSFVHLLIVPRKKKLPHMVRAWFFFQNLNFHFFWPNRDFKRKYFIFFTSETYFFIIDFDPLKWLFFCAFFACD